MSVADFRFVCYFCVPTYCTSPLVMMFSLTGLRLSVYDAIGSDLQTGPLA